MGSLQIRCPFCEGMFRLVSKEKSILCCPYCGNSLKKTTESTFTPSSPGYSEELTSGTISMIAGLTPTPQEVKYSIGPYQIISSIGKGGMGEVFLAYDTSCGRRIALKKIREDLLQHPQ